MSISNFRNIGSRIFADDKLSKRVHLNIKYLIFIKFFGIIMSYLLVRVTYNYINNNAIYGVWLTILSILSWINHFDLGLGNGLRNKLTECIANNNLNKGKIYVSTAYASIGMIVLLFITIYFIGSQFIDWNRIFNVYTINKSTLSLLLNIVVIFYLLRFLLSLINSISFSFQDAATPSLITLISNTMIVTILFVFQKVNIIGIIPLGYTYSIISVGALFVFSIFFFNSKYKYVKPTISKIKIKYTSGLFKLGIKFFVIQIAVLIIFATDNLIITHVLGPEYVTPYQISLKLFSIFILGTSIIMIPLWSAYTHAYTKGDYSWIRSILKKLLLLMIPVIIGVILMIFIGNRIILIWIGDKVKIQFMLLILMGIYTIIAIWNNIFSIILGGINKIRLGAYITTFTAISNVPLSILFAKKIGVSGVIVATILCLSITALISPIQVWYFIFSRRKSTRLNSILS